MVDLGNIGVIIIALRNEKGRYNLATNPAISNYIIALRNEKRCYYNTV